MIHLLVSTSVCMCRSVCICWCLRSVTSGAMHEHYLFMWCTLPVSVVVDVEAAHFTFDLCINILDIY